MGKNSGRTRQIFTCEGQNTLIAADLRAMTEVEYSPKGHNIRLLEEDTMYSWEILLQNCEGNSLLFPVVAYMFDRIDVFFQYSDIEWRYMIKDHAFNIIISAKCFLFFTSWKSKHQFGRDHVLLDRDRLYPPRRIWYNSEDLLFQQARERARNKVPNS